MYHLLFSYSCTFHVAATCNHAILDHCAGCIPTSTLYGVHNTESLEQIKGTLHVHPHQKKMAKQIPMQCFEEYVQGYVSPRKTDLTPLHLESELCLKFQYLLPHLVLSSLVLSSISTLGQKN